MIPARLPAKALSDGNLDVKAARVNHMGFTDGYAPVSVVTEHTHPCGILSHKELPVAAAAGHPLLFSRQHGLSGGNACHGGGKKIIKHHRLGPELLHTGEIRAWMSIGSQRVVALLVRHDKHNVHMGYYEKDCYGGQRNPGKNT